MSLARARVVEFKREDVRVQGADPRDGVEGRVLVGDRDSEVVARISLCGHLGRCDGGDRAAYDAQVVQRFDGRKAQLRACSRLLTRGFSEQLDENRGFCMIRLGEGVFKQRTRVSDGGPLDLLGSVYMAERDVVEAVEDPCIDVVEASDVDLRIAAHG